MYQKFLKDICGLLFGEITLLPAKTPAGADLPIRDADKILEMLVAQSLLWHSTGETILIQGTARIQTVNKEQHPRYYELLQAFKKKTGVPVLVNRKSLACTQRDAVECF